MQIENRLVMMQAWIDYHASGHVNWLVGRCAAEKARQLQGQFARTYDTELSRQTKSRRRRQGEATAVYFWYSRPTDPAQAIFLLLATDGLGRIHDREKLSAARPDLDGFELVHDGVRWSWQMSAVRFRWWRDRIHDLAALPPGRRRIAEGKDADAEKLLDALYAEPGFRLIRRQVGELVDLVVKEWVRLRPKGDPVPKKRGFLGYVRRMPRLATPIK